MALLHNNDQNTLSSTFRDFNNTQVGTYINVHQISIAVLLTKETGTGNAYISVEGVAEACVLRPQHRGGMHIPHTCQVLCVVYSRKYKTYMYKSVKSTKYSKPKPGSDASLHMLQRPGGGHAGTQSSHSTQVEINIKVVKIIKEQRDFRT